MFEGIYGCILVVVLDTLSSSTLPRFINAQDLFVNTGPGYMLIDYCSNCCTTKHNLNFQVHQDRTSSATSVTSCLAMKLFIHFVRFRLHQLAK